MYRQRSICTGVFRVVSHHRPVEMSCLGAADQQQQQQRERHVECVFQQNNRELKPTHVSTCPSCFLLALLQTEDCLVWTCKTPGMRNWIVKLTWSEVWWPPVNADEHEIVWLSCSVSVKPSSNPFWFLQKSTWLYLDFLAKRQSEMWTLYSNGIIWRVYFTWCPNNEQWSLVVWKRLLGEPLFELHECLAPQTSGQVRKWITINEIPGIYICLEAAGFQLWKIIEVSEGAFFHLSDGEIRSMIMTFLAAWERKDVTKWKIPASPFNSYATEVWG